jgi:GTP-binding protein
MSKDSLPVVAIVGRTNVGKSSLFNALSKRRVAVVEDTPGVSRDRNFINVRYEDYVFTAVDTGGLIGEEDYNKLADAVTKQSELAIRDSHLVLAVFDGLDGVNPLDEHVVNLLRKSGKEIIWVINKCEKPSTAVQSAEFYGLGLDEVICVSAAHRLGIDELGKAIIKKLSKLGFSPRIESEHDQVRENKPIRISIVGKPNVGKSSIVNKILGEDRVVVSELAGTTRDSIDSRVLRNGEPYILVDTAGLRKKARVEDGTIERFSNLRTLKSLVGCDVVCLVLDATDGTPTEQDQTIAELINQRGKPLMLIVNKWDLVEKDHRTVKAFTDRVYKSLPFVRYAPIIFVSALTGRRCPNIMERAAEVWSKAQKRIPTSDLNKMLDAAFKYNTPPVVRGEPIKLYFATQVSSNPPTIVMFMNYPKELPIAYVRYLKTKIRDHYDFAGSDLRFILKKRTQKNQDEIDREGREVF